MNQDLKIFIRHLCLFLLAFWLLDLFGVYIYLQSINALDVKEQYTVQPSDLFILGASHVGSGVDPKFFESCGVDTQSFAYKGQYSEFNYYLYQTIQAKDTTSPTILLISAPIFMFQKKSEPENLFWLHSSETLRDFYFQPSTLYKFKSYTYQNVILRTPYYLAYYMQGKNSPPRYGYNPTKKDLTQVAEPSESEVGSPLDYVNDQFSLNDRNNARSAHFFFLLLQEIGANKDFITFLVETPEYIGTQQYITNREAFYSEIETALQPYENIFFIPQTDIQSIDPSDKTLFLDGRYGKINSHLNFKGSQLYTQELQKIIQNDYPELFQCPNS